MADSSSNASVSPTTTTSTNITTASPPSTNADPLACQWAQCGERCTSPEKLYDHVCERHVGRKSTNNLNLQCQWGNCRTTTVKRDHITSHIRVHVPLKPHKCEFCGKSFKRPQDLKKHVKTHADESVLLRSPEPPVSSHKSNMASSYQPNTMRTSGYYQDTNSHVQAGSYGYPAGNANHNHFSAPITTASYGPVYYNVPQTTGYATGSAVESRKRGFDDLNDFFGNAKRRQIDATQYHDLGSRFGGLMNSGVQLSGFQAGYNAGLMAAGGGTLLDDHLTAASTYQPSHSVAPMQQHYTAPFAELKTKNDLMTLDQFLEQLQQTVYENPDHAAAAGVQPMSQMQHTGFSSGFRTSTSPPRVVHNPSVSSVGTGSDVFSNSYNHAASIASSSAFDDNTPALTPSSYAAASQSPATSQVNISPMARPVVTNASLYPTLPSFSTLTDLGGQQSGGISGAPPMSGLGATFDDFDTRRRYSGGFLQRAQPRLSPLSQMNPRSSIDSVGSGSETTASPSSRRSSVDLSKGFRSVNLSSPKPQNVKLPGVAAITRVDTRESIGSSGSEVSNSADDEKQEAWVKNMRVIEELLRYVRGRLDRGEYEGGAGKGGEERKEKETENQKEKEKHKEVDNDVEMKDSNAPHKTGASLYPVLRPMEATS